MLQTLLDQLLLNYPGYQLRQLPENTGSWAVTRPVVLQEMRGVVVLRARELAPGVCCGVGVDPIDQVVYVSHWSGPTEG